MGRSLCFNRRRARRAYSRPAAVALSQRDRNASWAAGIALLAVSIGDPVASIAFWSHWKSIRWRRWPSDLRDRLAHAETSLPSPSGKWSWGLNNHAMTEDPWDYVHITTWNFLPFLLRRVGAAPAWVVVSHLLCGLPASLRWRQPYGGCAASSRNAIDSQPPLSGHPQVSVRNQLIASGRCNEPG